MKKINTYVVLVYNSGTVKCSNRAAYRFNVGAKSEKEAESFVKDWLAEHNLTTKTRSPRTYFLDDTLSLNYKEVQQVYPKL